MKSNIAFIGGIHGVGKSSVCKRICDELEMQYLSASELLNWNKIEKDPKNKKIENILVTQNLLIAGLSKYFSDEKYYLLDGHYCLLNSKNEILHVPFETFKKMNLFSVNIILGEISQIKKCLELRDSKIYDYDLLERMQTEEFSYAKQLSKTLEINLNIGTQNEYFEILKSLRTSTTLK